MSVFKRGDRVRILENNSDMIYRIKDIRPVRTGGTLYLLKSLEESPAYRVLHEDDVFVLERIC